ncbi:MAG: hypothetical protein IKZ84_05615 [Victivallales bacterium]|nr:hypothetical protein [Victivallales bacterium]
MWKMMVMVAVAMACLATAVQAELAETLKRVRPNVEAEAMLGYYRENAPDLLEEIEKRRKAYPEAMDAYLGQLADHFQEVDKLRGEDNAAYDRMVKKEKQQCQVRRLSREIQQLAKPAKNEAKDAADQRLALLKESRLQLRKLLEHAFDEAQQQQLIQINKLESEVRDLRRLATERSKNRANILQERFRTLTGEDWPEEK